MQTVSNHDGAAATSNLEAEKPITDGYPRMSENGRMGDKARKDAEGPNLTQSGPSE